MNPTEVKSLNKQQRRSVACINQLMHSIITFVDVKIYVEIKCQLDATEVFIADLIACKQ